MEPYARLRASSDALWRQAGRSLGIHPGFRFAQSGLRTEGMTCWRRTKS